VVDAFGPLKRKPCRSSRDGGNDVCQITDLSQQDGGLARI
jgi:hypothetical protein